MRAFACVRVHLCDSFCMSVCVCVGGGGGCHCFLSAVHHFISPMNATSCLYLQTIAVTAEEIANAGIKDSRARASLLSTLPPLLRTITVPVLEVDTSAVSTSLLEKICLALKSADAAHPAIKETVTTVQRLRGKAAA